MPFGQCYDVDYKNIEEIGDVGDRGNRDRRLCPHAGYWTPAVPACESRLPTSGIDLTILSHTKISSLSALRDTAVTLWRTLKGTARSPIVCHPRQPAAESHPAVSRRL